MMRANFLVAAAFVAVVTMVAEAANSAAQANDETAYKAVQNCVTGTAKIYREATLTSAMEDANAGVISLQDPLYCDGRYCRE